MSVEGPALCGKNQIVTIVDRKSGNSHWGAYITGIGSISQAPNHCYLLLEGLGGLQDLRIT